jgi:hypothetical protein
VLVIGRDPKKDVSTMTWDETHRRWRALREIETRLAVAADAGRPVRLPWNEEYVELFGDRDGLVAALRYRWRLNRDTQLDTHLSEAALEEQRRRLEHRARGLLLVLDAEGRPEQGGHRVVA